MIMKRLNPEKKSHKRFGWLLGLLIFLIMVRYALQIDIPRVVFLGIIGLIALLGDRDEIVAMCMCCIPMHESIDFFYALVICGVVYVFKYHKQLRVGVSVPLVLLIVVWELLHCLETSFDVVTFLASVIPFIVLAILMASDAENRDYPFIVRTFAWATLGIIIVLFVRVLYFADFNIPNAIAGLQRLGSDRHSNIENVTVKGGQVNPNTLGIITVLASTGLMQLRSMKVGKKIDMVLMCTMLIFAALSTSRTYLACLVLMILLLIFSEKGGIKRKLRLIAVLCVAITAAVLAFAVIFPESYAYFISRFLVSDITTGRDDLMMLYNRFIVENPKVMLFGIGMQDYGNRLLNVFRVAGNLPHNSIQEMIIAWGIPGLLLFGVLIFCMFRSSCYRNRNQSLLNWIPLIIILFKSLAGQMITSAYTMLALSYAYLSLCTDMTPKDENRIYTRAQTNR